MPNNTPRNSDLIHSTGNANYNTSPDVFEKVIHAIPEDQQEILRHWYFMGKDHSWSLTKLAKVSGVSSSTLSRIFSGNYGAELVSVCATLVQARETFVETIDNPEFIMTSLAKHIFRICDRTRSLKTVTLMWGAMGIGKTTVAEEYKRRNNHGRTLYYRCSPGLTFVQLVTELSRACGVSGSKQTHLRLREKLFTVLSAGNRLLIVDELHQLFLRRASSDITAVMQCEFLRECYDRSNCGMVFFGTKALEKHMVAQKESLAQLLDRGTMPRITLAPKPTKSDVKQFVANYGLPELTEREPQAAAIIADILASSGLRKLTMHLRDGAATAAKQGEKYVWHHFVTTFEDIQSLSK